MSNTFLFGVPSRPTIDFLPALGATLATFQPPFVGGVIQNLPGLPWVNSRRYLIRAIRYLANENIGLEFDFFSTALGLTGVVGTDKFVSRYQFASVNGVQFNGVGPYRYYVDGLAIPIHDEDSINANTPPLLHVAIQNIDTVAKSAAPVGAMEAVFYVEPMQAW